MIAYFPLPLWERVAAKQPGEGAFAPLPLTHLRVLQAKVQPSPTRGEGADISAKDFT